MEDRTKAAFTAVENGDADALGSILADDPGVASARNDDGVSLVLFARYRFRMDMVERVLAAEPTLDLFDAAAVGPPGRVADLLERDPAGAAAYSSDGFTALHLAAFFGRPEEAALLLERGADPKALAKNGSDLRPLHSAVAGRSFPIVERLLAAGVDVDAQQQGGFTALMAAAMHGMEDCVDALLAAGADRTVEAEGKTAADMADEKGHVELAARLR